MLTIVAAARASCGNLTNRSQRLAITNDFHIDCIGVKLIAIIGLGVNSQLAGHADSHILDTVQVDITVLFSTDFDLVANIVDLELTSHSHIALIRHCERPGVRQAIPSGIHRLTGAVRHHNFCCLIANGRLQSHGHFCSVLSLAGNINVTGPHAVRSLVRLGHSNDIAVSRLGRLIRQRTIRIQNGQGSCYRKCFALGLTHISTVIDRTPLCNRGIDIIITGHNRIRHSHSQFSHITRNISHTSHRKFINGIKPISLRRTFTADSHANRFQGIPLQVTLNGFCRRITGKHQRCRLLTAALTDLTLKISIQRCTVNGIAGAKHRCRKQRENHYENEQQRSETLRFLVHKNLLLSKFWITEDKKLITFSPDSSTA